MQTLEEHAKNIGDVAAGIGAAGALFNAMPKIAAALAVFWYIWRFWDVWGRAWWARLRARWGAR